MRITSKIHRLIPDDYISSLRYISEKSDKDKDRVISVYKDKDLIFLEKDPIILARYPKGAELEDSIIVNPRYADEKYFELIEVRGYRHGRSIDILVGPRTHNGQTYKILNIKGTGAEADGRAMVIDTERWYVGNNMAARWKPLSEAKKESLGRRWGLLSQDAGKEEYDYNIFNEFLESDSVQIPHIKLNYVPPEVLQFDNMAQLVRGLNTNIRCDDVFLNTVALQKNIEPELFSEMDAKIFFTQKKLFSKNQGIIMVGHLANNRYIDGRITDMENYTIKNAEKEDELINLSGSFCLDLISSAIIAMRNHKPGRVKYWQQLEEKTNFPASKYANYNLKLFMEYLLPKKEKNDLGLAIERTMMIQSFRETFMQFMKK